MAAHLPALPLPPDLATIRRALRRPLPGHAAQVTMMARPLTPGLVLPERFLDAGVLVLLYPLNGALHVALTRRTAHLAAHGGQISFPGGLCEAGDSSTAATALRETHEELGLAPECIELLGPLSPLEIPVSGYRIHPWVAYAACEPAFRPDPFEVAEVIEAPLAQLLDRRTAAVEMWTIRGHEARVPFFHVGEHKVWGATAMVLAELLALIRGVGSDEGGPGNGE